MPNLQNTGDEQGGAHLHSSPSWNTILGVVLTSAFFKTSIGSVNTTSSIMGLDLVSTPIPTTYL